ncbi:uncharacterized protein UHOD_11687 [Ustilago sp. UG-2017b]|nr:uncharacterized protein UHOD_11687 [Ustilago sp. UG-2017b]
MEWDGRREMGVRRAAREGLLRLRREMKGDASPQKERRNHKSHQIHDNENQFHGSSLGLEAENNVRQNKAAFFVVQPNVIHAHAHAHTHTHTHTLADVHSQRQTELTDRKRAFFKGKDRQMNEWMSGFSTTAAGVVN